MSSTAAAKKKKENPSKKTGIEINRFFTKEGESVFENLEFDTRSSAITTPDGQVVFEMKELEIPASWSQLATDIMASKYIRRSGVPETGHEVSARQVVSRLAETIREAGEERGYFKDEKAAQGFEDELKFLLINQYGAFNSPVWFNLGLYAKYGIKGSGGNWAWDDEQQDCVEVPYAYARPQCSACFIQSVDDDLTSIFELIGKEAKLFKYGSGTGTNFSKLRSRHEKLSGGGTSSGLISFLEVLDRGAGATKSGGTTRRAAKMVSLDMDHPEIIDFIDWKAKEEGKAQALIAAGYPSDFNGDAYHTVSGQNSNNSVRVNDEFMKAYEEDGDWSTTFRTTGEVHKTYKAKDLFTKIAESAWVCADPGMQYDTTINDWHTCPNTDKINGSNPCSEFMFIDDTACNLASLNLMKFWPAGGSFDLEGYRSAIKTFSIAQEILVDFSSYPTKQVAMNSHRFRPLGLGYANLGTLLMVKGMPYDSEEGRATAGALTAILTGRAYAASAEIAATKGAFKDFDKNREPMLKVMKKHRRAVDEIPTDFCDADLLKAAEEDWDLAIESGKQYGYRNSQMTVLAPTGTIGLLMDCDTTGVEPDFSIVKWKKLAGGGYFRIVNQSLHMALETLGYSESHVTDIIEYILGTASLENDTAAGIENLRSLGFSPEDIEAAANAVKATGQLTDFTPGVNPSLLKAKGVSQEDIEKALLIINGTGTIEGAPHLSVEHYPVFDCANKCGTGSRFIQPIAHVKMMAAVQPFLSGAISKTVNIPHEATVEDIADLYYQGWKSGLKAVALYRDGSKGSQPLNTSEEKKEVTEEVAIEYKGLKWGERKVLPKKRRGVTLESSVAGHKLFLRTGEYDDGALGEIFIDMYKEGAAYRSMMNCFAIAVSIGLSYGVPLDKYVNSFTFTRFDPHGFTDHPNIKNSTSILDFIFRVLGMEYLGRTDFVHVPPTPEEGKILDIVDSSTKGPSYDGNTEQVAEDQMEAQMAEMMGDAPNCDKCGHITVRNGSCYRCLNCGNSMGCS